MKPPAQQKRYHYSATTLTRQCASLISSVIAIVLLCSSCDCREDIYGDVMIFEIPISTTAPSTVITTSDSITIHSKFSKNVNIAGYDEPVYLENFDFLTAVYVMEISEPEIKLAIDFDIDVSRGSIDTISASLGVSEVLNEFAINFDQTGDFYRFDAKLIFHEPGLYFILFVEFEEGFQWMEHPALYKCEGERREFVEVFVNNPAGDSTNYEAEFLSKSRLPSLARRYPFEDYIDFGGFAVEVVE